MEIARMKINGLMATLVSELIRSEKVIDQNAETIDEICESSGMKRSSAEKSVFNKIKLGLVEQVWKESNGRTKKAYRIKRHETKTRAENSRRR